MRRFGWRVLCIGQVVVTYYTFTFIFANLREGRYDPMARVIGWEVLAIYVMAEITAVGAYIAVRDWWAARRAGTR